MELIDKIKGFIFLSEEEIEAERELDRFSKELVEASGINYWAMVREQLLDHVGFWRKSWWRRK